MKLEIIAETAADALAAEAGGATQLELVCALAEGGLTPSAGTIEHVCSSVSIPVLVMIRSHARCFVYSEADFAVMRSDIRLAHRLGAGGLMVGCITPDRRLDIAAIMSLRDAAEGCPLHFHLAWQLAEDRPQALETLIELGVQSVRLTGHADVTSRAIDGLEAMRSFAQQSAGRIELFTSVGVNAANIGSIVAATGIENTHSGTGVRLPPTAHGAVDAAKVRELAQALSQAVERLHAPLGS